MSEKLEAKIKALETLQASSQARHRLLSKEIEYEKTLRENAIKELHRVQEALEAALLVNVKLEESYGKSPYFVNLRERMYDYQFNARMLYDTCEQIALGQYSAVGCQEIAELTLAKLRETI